MEQQDSEEDQFYKVLQENLRYVFTSPMSTTQVFPTPYSQLQQAKRDMKLSSVGAGLSIDDTNDSSSVENSMLPLQGSVHGNGGSGAALGKSATGSAGDGVHTASGLKGGRLKSLIDVNTQPSMVFNYENFPNEIFLDLSDQFKEFREYLQDSPASINWQAKTPAKTPLKFLQYQQQYQHAQQHTPLQNLDINNMFNSAGRSTLSPTKRLYSLTPYNRKLVGDGDTPFGRILPTSSTSNNALADFQKARKEENPLVKTPVTKRARQLNNRKPENFNAALSGSFVSSLASRGAYAVNAAPVVSDSALARDVVGNPPDLHHGQHADHDEQDYGSSPTTIPLASSVTKSARNTATRSPVSGQENPPILDNRVFDVAASPTPKLKKSPPPGELSLRVPELPKLGSFKGVSARPQLIPATSRSKLRDNATALNSNVSMHTIGANRTKSGNSVKAASSVTAVNKFPPKNKGKTKSGQPQQSKFQFVMTNTNSFSMNNDGAASNKRKLKRSQSTLISFEQHNSKSSNSPTDTISKVSTTTTTSTSKRRKKNFSSSQ
ncbi:HDL172Cp [Eremothecium sinecaudum]|uniref:HDL172Cp n=1 Tax=Eremothecium sinecaudum TaxID=45286 RepID=A0A0X8HS90_9SACH|nr:HDL172Cp [Eremothecium sinecaudum]AMD20572.1 HDL172Cp [Eremothecium sinecaudum]